jgi:hypothetical protein
METTKRKRIIIIFVYLVIFISIGWFIYSITRPKETCLDKIKNQNEEDVDCGGVCTPCKHIEAQPLTIGETGVVNSGVADQYDFYSVIINPNNVFGGSKVSYEIHLKDSSGNILAKKEGMTFILPGEKKYIVENNIPSSVSPSSSEIIIKSTEWKHFSDYYKNPELEIVNRNYRTINSGVGFAEVTGLLRNKSPFDFNEIVIRVILKDSAGKVIALNSTSMKTVKTGEERDFRTFWPSRFPEAESVQNVETQAEVNVFDSEAFVKRYFDIQKF